MTVVVAVGETTITSSLLLAVGLAMLVVAAKEGPATVVAMLGLGRTIRRRNTRPTQTMMPALVF